MNEVAAFELGAEEASVVVMKGEGHVGGDAKIKLGIEAPHHAGCEDHAERAGVHVAKEAGAEAKIILLLGFLKFLSLGSGHG